MKAKSRHKKILTTGVLMFVLIAAQSCYHCRVSSTKSDPATNYSKKRADSFFWGLYQKRNTGVDVVTANCDTIDTKMAEVRVSTNYAYALITVVSLGIWCPVQVQWKCAKPCAREGSIP